MEENLSTANPNPQNQKEKATCEECKTSPSKYKCPGCSLRSCSLLCVKAHKQRTGCTGKRPLTDFLPLSEFNDNILISDYNMLEDVKRVAESAQRMRLKLCGKSHVRLPYPLKSLRSAAASRRTKLLFLSNGMSKREMNQTYYNNRKKFISWTIEWRFHSTDVVLVDHGVHENTNLCSVIENHLEGGPWNHRLRQFNDEPLDSLNFFIRKYPKGPRSPYRKLNIKASIREQLANLVILEYPVIHVFLPSHNHDFEVINDVIPKKVELNKPVDNDFPEGVTFKEEEIEDSGLSRPHISDLLEHANQNMVTETEFQESVYSPLVVRCVQEDKSVLSSGASVWKEEEYYIGKELGIPEEDMNFDFEQGLVSVYSDLIEETNPDDFLMEEELEEGEIA
ncbi:HIT-type Zinc finger family protein [Abeliophyllum distichum]|uniref:Box C/D snoRNA protein 1 n=1 Tax=Abeliophyllum distichum TaxID=126358 RepID=A0ABD1PBM5_9LAMI